MNWLSIQIDAIPYWDPQYRLKQDVLQGFEKEQLEFMSKLKEKLSIDKVTARFLKKATEKYDFDLMEFGKNKEVISMDCYLFEVQNAVTTDDDVHGAFESFRQSIDFLKYEPEWKPRKMIKEVDLVPKELLKITGEISLFLRDSLKADFKVIFNHLEIPKSETFLIELLDHANKEDICDPLSSVIKRIDVLGFNENDYLEEGLNCDTSIPVVFEENLPETLSAVKKTDYFIPVIDQLFQNEKIHHQKLEFPFWSCPSFTTASEESLVQFEKFTIEEELQKGIQYRLKALFMDDAPTFDEPRLPLDLIDIDALLPYQRVTFTLDLKLSNIAGEISEFDAVEEELHETCHINIQSSEIKPAPIREFDVYLLEIEDDHCVNDPDISKEEEPLKLSELLINDESDEVSQNPTVLKNSNINIGDATETTNKTSVTEVNEESSLAATKMVTTIQNNTDPLTSKRDLDDELDELIVRKRKKVSKGNSHEKSSNSLSLASMLLSSTKAHDLPVLDDDTTVTDAGIAEDQPKCHSLFPNQEVTETKYLGVNSSLMEIESNVKIIRKFDKHETIEIIEFELGKDDVDFILSNTHGLMILEYKNCLQTNGNNELVIQERLFKSLMEFKRLDLLLIIRPSDDFENILYLQTCLVMMAIDVHVVNDNVENIIQWIQSIIISSDNDLKEYEDLDETSPQINFLKSCGINCIAGHQILQQLENLADFIIMENKERKERFSSLLPSAQLEYVNTLLNLDWQWESEQ